MSARRIAIAFRMQQWQSASMAIQITIRDVPEKVRDELALTSLPTSMMGNP
jgi:hypothetical protein